MKKITFMAIIFVIFLFSEPILLSAQEASGVDQITVNEKTLAMMPCLYVKKNIVTEAVFMDVSSTLLDDRFHDVNTRFDSQEYLNFRTIGNGMSYYFIKQKKADIIPTLKAGDKIVISGKVKSCADKHPWIEVNSLVKAPSALSE